MHLKHYKNNLIYLSHKHMKRKVSFYNSSFKKQKNQFLQLKKKLKEKVMLIEKENDSNVIKELDLNVINEQNEPNNKISNFLLHKLNTLRTRNIQSETINVNISKEDLKNNTDLMSNKLQNEIQKKLIKKDSINNQIFNFLDDSFHSVHMSGKKVNFEKERITNDKNLKGIPNLHYKPHFYDDKLTNNEDKQVKRLKKVAIPLKSEYSIVELALELKIKKIKFDSLNLQGIEKIAEASFSDVYMLENKIYKIIPLNSEDNPTLDEFLKEAYIHSKINEEKGVCKLLGVYLVKGKYSIDLLNAWERYKILKGSENTHPSIYESNQLYGIFILEECGEDLENYKFKNKKEVCSIITKYFRTLANLETKYEFEHRDLHWGNILIKDSCPKIIDFSLSRISSDKIVFIDLQEKHWLFGGDEKIDEQFGVYKSMKRLTNNNWLIHNPQNNVLWLVYFINKIIYLTDGTIKMSRFLIKLRNKIKDCKSAEQAYQILINIFGIYK